MKRIGRLLLCIVVLLINLEAFSQGSPQGLYYQAVARGVEGEQLIEEELSIRLNVLEDDLIVYTELHFPTTDSFGLFELFIGSGIVEEGQFSTINWGGDTHFLNIELDFGDGYESISTTQFLSVPYSLFSTQAETVINDNVDDADNDPQNELIQSFLIEDENLVLNEGGDTFTIPLAEFTDDGDWSINDDNQTLSSQDYNVGINTSNPSSTLVVNGSLAVNVQTIASDLNDTVETELGVNNSIVLCDVAVGSIILNLPAASESTGRMYTLKRFSSILTNTTLPSNTLSLVPQLTDFIDFQPVLVLDTNDYEQIIITSDGNNWFILSYSINP